MIEITSVSNSVVKEVVKLHQKKYRENFIIVEGKKALDGAIDANLKIKCLFSEDKNLLSQYQNNAKDAEIYFVNEKVMEKISTTESAPVVLAVVKKPVCDINNFKNYKNIVLLDSIKDAGNLGTIIRTAAAFNIDGVLLFGECTDEFSPKTIRSSAGNIFKIPIAHAPMEQLINLKKTHKMVTTVVNSKNSIDNFNPKSPCVVMFGSEADGLCEELLNLADVSYTIPMKDGVESLNLAVSAGIILHKMYSL